MLIIKITKKRQQILEINYLDKEFNKQAIKANTK